MFSLFFFLLNVNAGMQVRGLQSLPVEQGTTVHNKMFIIFPSGGDVTAGICFSVTKITQSFIQISSTLRADNDGDVPDSGGTIDLPLTMSCDLV